MWVQSTYTRHIFSDIYTLVEIDSIVFGFRRAKSSAKSRREVDDNGGSVCNDWTMYATGAAGLVGT